MKRLVPTRRKLGWFVLSLLGIALLGWRLQKPVPGLVILGPPTITNNHYEILVTNHTGRSISCRLSLPQYLRAGEWELLQSSQIHQLVNGQLRPPPPSDQVPPKTAIKLAGQEPRYISAPFEATSWRTAVIWSYDEQTAWEKWLYDLHTWMHGHPPHTLPIMYTNYSSEIPFRSKGASRLPKFLHP